MTSPRELILGEFFPEVRRFLKSRPEIGIEEFIRDGINMRAHRQVWIESVDKSDPVEFLKALTVKGKMPTTFPGTSEEGSADGENT